MKKLILSAVTTVLFTSTIAMVEEAMIFIGNQVKKTSKIKN